MLEIQAITRQHRLWSETISFAENCSWRAGAYLAELMRQNEFADWERVFVARDDERVVAYCTFTAKDELAEKYEFSPFIGFMFVDESYRGKRISGMLIKTACAYASALGYEKVYIMSDEQGLYEKYGFQKLGEYETIYGSREQLFVRNTK